MSFSPPQSRELGQLHSTSIDAVRAVLAWIVVAAHISWFTGADLRFPLLRFVHPLAANAVAIFIIISGFVIANLVVTKQEPYLHYIIRRGLRIFPAYFVCLVAGMISMNLMFDTFLTLPWGADTPHYNDLLRQSASLSSGFYPHLLAHLVLLQGTIPDNILYYSQMMFLVPAWSLSLEWQFYLLAPLIVWGALRYQMIATGLAACAFLAYTTGVFGEFALPSFLPGGILLLLTGIITRFALRSLPILRQYPFALIVVLVALSLRSSIFQPFVAWAALVAFLLLKTQTWANHSAIRLSSSILGKLGQWSYATYLVHVPVIQVILFFAVKWGLLPQQALYVVLILTVPITLLLSFLLYRYVEKPAIAFGKRLFASSAPPYQTLSQSFDT